MAVSALPDALGMPLIGEWAAVLLLIVPVHLLLAMRRFYEESWPRTVLKWAAVSWAYATVGTVTLVSLLVGSLLTI